MDPIFEILTILVTSFLINLIPPAGPSNLLVASNAAIAAIDVAPFTIGAAVAFGSVLTRAYQSR